MRSSFRSFGLASLSILALAVVGCGANTDPAPQPPTTESGVTAQDPCAQKACGVDCTPAGSDEPFNCNSAGKCVATGEPLGCTTTPSTNVCAGKVCGQDCSAPGSDEPFNCNSAGRCVAAGASLGCEAYPSPACAQKACGADCTPEGSDEPFNCASNGWCVAAGQPLGCK